MTVPEFTVIPDSVHEANKPVLASTAQETKDNLLSVAGGGVGAPRIVLKALERLVAGTGGGVSDIGSFILPSGALAFHTIHSYGFIQIGTIQVQIERSGGVAEQMRVSRVRNQASTVIVAASSANLDAEISVIAGDEILIEAQTSTTSDITYTARFDTALGVSLFPSVPGAILSGNDVS